MVPVSELRELWVFWRHASQILTRVLERESKTCSNPGGITLQKLSDTLHILYISRLFFLIVSFIVNLQAWMC